MKTITSFKLFDLTKKTPYFSSHVMKIDEQKEYPEVSHLRAMKYTDMDANRTDIRKKKR